MAISTPNAGVVRSEGLEPPRCYPLPPQGSASTNSATSAKYHRQAGSGPDQRRRCNKSTLGGQGPPDPQIPRFAVDFVPIPRPRQKSAFSCHLKLFLPVQSFGKK